MEGGVGCVGAGLGSCCFKVWLSSEEKGKKAGLGRVGVRKWAWLRAGTAYAKGFNKGHLT